MSRQGRLNTCLTTHAAWKSSAVSTATTQQPPPSVAVGGAGSAVAVCLYGCAAAGRAPPPCTAVSTAAASRKASAPKAPAPLSPPPRHPAPGTTRCRRCSSPASPTCAPGRETLTAFRNACCSQKQLKKRKAVDTRPRLSLGVAGRAFLPGGGRFYDQVAGAVELDRPAPDDVRLRRPEVIRAINAIRGVSMGVSRLTRSGSKEMAQPLPNLPARHLFGCDTASVIGVSPAHCGPNHLAGGAPRLPAARPCRSSHRRPAPSSASSGRPRPTQRRPEEMTRSRWLIYCAPLQHHRNLFGAAAPKEMTHSRCLISITPCISSASLWRRGLTCSSGYGSSASHGTCRDGHVHGRENRIRAERPPSLGGGLLSGCPWFGATEMVRRAAVTCGRQTVRVRSDLAPSLRPRTWAAVVYVAIVGCQQW